MATIGPAADLFALGCVIFECLTGRRAFAGIEPVATCAKIIFDEPPPVSDICPEVPPAIEMLVERLLRKAPEERPADGTALLAELEGLDESAPGPTRRIALSGGEQRIVSILMASDPSLDLYDSEAATIPNSLIQAQDSELWVTIRELGGHLERLSDGSLVAQMHGKGTATDAAGRAARLALTLRNRLPKMVTVLTTGTAQAGGRVPVGEIIDRAAEMLRRESKRAAAENSVSRLVIRVDELTAGLLDTRFEIAGDEHGLILRGQREPLVIDRTLLGARTPFVGRARELGHLVATLEESIEESVARAVVVTAPAGIGKSRLSAEFLRRLPERDQLHLFLARGEIVGAGSTYGLLAQGLRREFGIRDGESLSLRRGKLHSHLVRYLSGDELEQVATFLGELIG
ncbi:MAG: AAA family ATPase, partial [Myxococcota bacterium]